jgi:hypothetical protein
MRVRRTRMKQDDWQYLSKENQALEIERLEADVIGKRMEKGEDADSKIAKILDQEIIDLRAIDEEENAEKIARLGPGIIVSNSHGIQSRKCSSFNNK